MDEEPTPSGTDSFLTELKEHRVYRVALGYGVSAWIVLQVAAIVLPGFGAPPWVLRALMILLALGFGAALLMGWTTDRRTAGLPLLPRALRGRVGWVLTSLLPTAAVTTFFLLRPLSSRPPAGAPRAVEKSIAVLPFDNFSEDKDSAFFADGVQDEVLTDLSKLADLKVISRSSVMQYRKADTRNLREIGKVLDVAYVVEGSVQRAGNRIKVAAQLIDTRTDTHRWAEEYVDDLSDVFAIQSKIAQAIAGQLHASISPQEHTAMLEVPTHDEQAYQFYLRAITQWNDFDRLTTDPQALFKNTLDLLGQATARDPGFVRAFAFMTEVQSLLYYNFDRTPARDDAARDSEAATARLRPGSADANVAAAYYTYYVRHDYPRAYAEFTEVTRQSPNDARAYACLGKISRRQGRWEDALTNLRRASELDPESNLNVTTYLEVLEQALRRYPEALAGFDRRIATHPQELWLHLAKAEFLLRWKGDTHAARAELALLPPAFDPGGSVTDCRLDCDAFDQDAIAATRDLAACPLAEINGQPRALYEGIAARNRGDAPAAAAAFTKARVLLDAQVTAQPANPWTLIVLALADAALDHKDIALEESHHAVTLSPPGDTQAGPTMTKFAAQVLTWAGERDEAIRTLQAISGKPYGPDYGYLRFDPAWEPLRSDPRFEALVASLAPK